MSRTRARRSAAAARALGSTRVGTDVPSGRSAVTNTPFIGPGSFPVLGAPVKTAQNLVLYDSVSSLRLDGPGPEDGGGRHSVFNDGTVSVAIWLSGCSSQN